MSGSSIVDAEGKVHVPEGYHWCSECNALIPFTWDERRWNRVCVLCGSATLDSSDSCPNCHADTEEDHGPFEQVVTMHRDGCHLKRPDPVEYFVELNNGEKERFEHHPQPQSDVILRAFRDDVERMLRRMFPKNITGWGEAWRFPDDREANDFVSRWRRRVRDAEKMKCGCPRVTIYRGLDIRNYSYRSVYSQDCMDAGEWSYERRCQICGEWFEIEDGNC